MFRNFAFHRESFFDSLLFFKASDKEEPKDCSVCGKIVYPVEKVQLEKKVFHKQCFKCCKCQKRLRYDNTWVEVK